MRILLSAAVLLAALVSQGTAHRFSFSPVFPVSQYDTSEDLGQLVIQLSAPILTRPFFPSFTGSIEVDIESTGMPTDNLQQEAEFRTDYVVRENPQFYSFPNFTVVFQSRHSNSSEHVIKITDDSILEDREYFRLRISAVRFIGQPTMLFRAQDRVTSTFVDVSIEDNDFVLVNWTMTQTMINVTEGDGVTVKLSAEAFGKYAYAIEVGVVCAETMAADVEPAFPGRDFNIIGRSVLRFEEFNTIQSHSSDQVIIAIIDDDITEPKESFICTLQVGNLYNVRTICPSQVTIEICDDEELNVYWSEDFYDFHESDVAARVKLVTTSTFEVDQIKVLGFPKEIPYGHPNRISSLTVPGPVIPGFPALNAAIERVSFKGVAYGNAQVKLAGRTDVQRTSNDFVFTPTSNTSLEIFKIDDDNVLEFDELFIAEFVFGPEISNKWNVRKGIPSTTYILIRDDDFVEVNFSEDSYSVAEGDSQVSVSLRITGKYFIPVYAIVKVSSGTATDPEDYSSTRHYNIIFPQTTFLDGDDPAPFAVSPPFFIDIVDNVIFEGVEYFQIQIVETSDRFRVKIGPQGTVNVTITDDDKNIEIFHEQTTYSTFENEMQFNITLRMSEPYQQDISVTVDVDELEGVPELIKAQAEADFSTTGFPKQVAIPAGQTSVQFAITVTNEDIVEKDEQFQVSFTYSGGQPGVIVRPGFDEVNITIKNDDSITVQFEQDMYMVQESEGMVDIRVVASGRTSFDYTFTVTSMDITATINFDYIFSPNEYAFDPVSDNEPIPSLVITIPIETDDDNELDEDFKLTIEVSDEARAANVTEGEISMTVVLIKDDDIVSISFSPLILVYTVPEGTPAELMIVLDKPSVRNITVAVTTMDITAQSPTDYVGGSLYVSVPAGTVEVTLPVTTLFDNLAENNEHFKATLSLPDGPKDMVVGSLDVVFVTITDTKPITIQFEQDQYMVQESDGKVDIRVIASGRTSFPYTFTVTPMDITATNTLDYIFSPTTFQLQPAADNEPIPSTVLSISIIRDPDNEFNETFQLTIEVSDAARASNIFEGETSTTVVLIKDDDIVTINFGPTIVYTVPEGTLAKVMIVLDKPCVKDITVAVTTMDITAQSPTDYIGGSFDVSVPAGAVEVTLPVTTLVDNLVENNEYFKATLSLPDGPGYVVVGSLYVVFVTINDTKLMIPVRFNPANYSVKEGVDSNAVIFLEALADHTDFDFTVTVRTQDGTAIRGSDYEGDSFSVTFPAGVNVISFNVTIIDDNIAECAKLFTLDLEIPGVAAAMGVIKGSPDSATVHIFDDDVEDLFISIENAEYLVKEDVGSFPAAVTASRAADFPYTVTVVTADGSAVGGADFVSQQFQLNFPAGETRANFNVTILDDNVIENMESFLLLLSIPNNLTSKGVQVGPNAAATVTIMDNDVQVKFSRPLVSTTEEEGQVIITVLAMGDLSSDFSIIVMAINGTSVETLDFTGNMWRVDFPTGVTEASFIIPIVQDTIVEAAEEFSLKIVIESPLDQRVTVGDPSMQTVLITDLRNDTVRGGGGAVFSIPLPSKSTNGTEFQNMQLCFEVHGKAGNHYNLVSDECTSVTAKYSQGVVDSSLNVITKIGVKAQGSNGTCHNIEVDLDNCSAYLDSTLMNTTSTVSVNGVTMTIRHQRVRVSVPNCDSNKKLTMWMICTKRRNDDMLELVIARGDGLQPTAHGLIGQFWNIPLTIAPYTGQYGDGTAQLSDRIYSITASYPGAPERTFHADYGKKDWLDNRPCLYAGSHNAGPIWEIQGTDSVIEGKASNYVVDGLFDTDFQFSKFTANC